MKAKTLIATAVASAIAITPATAFAKGASSPAPAPTPKPTLAEVLLSDKAYDDANGFDRSWKDFDIVTQAVLAFPDLTAAALDPTASLTAFLPTDKAFWLFYWELTGKKAQSEKEIFDALATNPALKTILEYHIVPAKIPASAAVQANGAVLDTLVKDAKITVKVKNGHHHKKAPTIILKDLDTNDRNPRVVATDIGGEASNGYAHGIDGVLRPLDLP